MLLLLQSDTIITTGYIFAWIFTVLCSLLIVFQLALVFGAPLGEYAWGGKYDGKLPMSLRFGSLLAVFVFAAGILSVIETAGIAHVLNLGGLDKFAVWVFFGLFAFSSIGNINSESEKEKMIMTPIAVFLCFSCFVIAWSY